MMLVFFGFIATAALPESARSDAGFAAAIVAVVLAGIAVYAVVAPSLSVTMLKGALGQRIEIDAAIRQGLRVALRFWGLSLLVGLLTVVGFLLFIVPGLFIMKRYMLAGYYLIDHNLGVFEAMRRCAADSKRYSGALWGIIGVQFLIGLSSFIPGLGSILSLLYMGAPAARYAEIKYADSLPPLDAAPTPRAPIPPMAPLPPKA